MTTAYTSLLGLALPVTGELSGTWGDTVNNAITSLVDTAIAGTTTLSTDGDVTLTTTTGASNQARQAILLCSGARTAARNITAPAQSKIYTVINATTGGYAVTIRGAGPTTGITIPAGQTATVAWNGSDFVDASNYFGGNLKVNGNLSVTGTTALTGVATLTANPILSAGTANGIAYLNGSKAVTTSSTFGWDTTTLYMGRTPSTWTGLAGNVLQGGHWAIVEEGQNAVDLVQNAEANGSGGWQRTGAYPAAMYQQQNGAHIFYYTPTGTAGSAISSWSHLATLNSTGLGIFDSSPQVGLAVSKNNPTRGIMAQFSNSASSSQTGALLWVVQNGQADWMLGATPNSTSFSIYTGRTLNQDGTELWQLTSSGSLTQYSTDTNASILFSGATRATFTLRGRYSSGSSGTDIGQIGFQNSANGNVANIYAYTYNGSSSSASGDLVFRVSVGGSLTQSMIMSASNLALGVGGANPQAWGSFTGPVQFPNGGHIVAAGGNFMQVAANCYYDGTNYRRVEAGYASRYTQGTGTHFWESAVSTSSGSTIAWNTVLEGDYKYLRFNTSGNNMGSSVGVFTINGLAAFAGSAEPLGNIGGGFAIGGSYSSPVAGRIFFGDGTGWLWEWGTFGSSVTWSRKFYFTDGGAGYNATGTWGTISDAALKENIVDATPKLAELMQLRVRNFNLIGDEDNKQIGFVAQEVEQIFPRMVDTPKPDKDGNAYKAVKTSVMVPMLVKAMQEQQALIEQLVARLDAANL